jgi:hypothetical protein
MAANVIVPAISAVESNPETLSIVASTVSDLAAKVKDVALAILSFLSKYVAIGIEHAGSFFKFIGSYISQGSSIAWSSGSKFAAWAGNNISVIGKAAFKQMSAAGSSSFSYLSANPPVLIGSAIGIGLGAALTYAFVHHKKDHAV